MNRDSDPEDFQQALRDVLPDMAAPTIEKEILIEIDASYRERRSDEQVLSRFFGICMIMIGLITIVPAIYCGVTLSQQDVLGPVPRWAYLAGFLAALQWIYGFYIWQLVDYSVLQMLSAFLLLLTCLYGFAGVSLLLDEGGGAVTRFLQLPTSLKQRGMIWCGIMFGINALASYLCGREAMTWHRRTLLRKRSGSP